LDIRVRGEKVGWVFEDLGGGIDACFREVLGLDSSHLEAIQADSLES